MTEGLDFDTALTVVRSSTVFTTHTGTRGHRSVPGGDGEAVLRQSGGQPVRCQLAAAAGVPLDRIIAFGAEDDPSKFNMAHMGLRLAQRANGVPLLHGRVSREMFSELWPGFDPNEVPIGSITNGVHAPTWAAPQWLELGRELLGSDSPSEPAVWQRLQQVDPGHMAIRSTTRAADRADVGAGCGDPGWSGASDAELAGSQRRSIPDVLTIGFARRVPTYKRLTLMLRDPERLEKLLLDEKRPIQLIVAGKSHPADDGKALIQQVVRSPTGPRCGTASRSCPTTTCRWPACCTGAATSG